jgi:putative transposase
MDWSPKRLTRAQMEERRREGAKLIRAGKLSYAAIGQRLGVSGAAVGQWAKQLDEGSLRSLKARVAPGRPARLTPAQKGVLRRRLKRGALAAGFPTDRWTMGRVGQLIEREFGVRYHVKYINRLLTGLGWSLQQPLPQAAERDEDLIRAWLAQDWPRIKKGAAARRKHSVL